MIAVADTSPICYLILINEVDLLPRLFSQVLVPPAVVAELLHGDAPGAVREWAASFPSWISVQESSVRTTAGMEKLQACELQVRWVCWAKLPHEGWLIWQWQWTASGKLSRSAKSDS